MSEILTVASVGPGGERLFATPSRHDALPIADMLSMPEGGLAVLQVVVLALVTYGKNRDDVAAFDLEQGYIPCCAERNDEFAQKWTALAAGLPIAERGMLETGNGVADGVQRAFRQRPVGHVAIKDEFIQPNQVRFGFTRESDAECHFAAAVRLAFCNIPSNRPRTLPAGT